MKKAFCFDYFSMSQSKSKFFHVWFEFFPSYLSRKKEILETFLSLGLQPQPQKIFPRFPFFFFGNLGKTQIRRGKILLQTWHWKKSKQNTISLDKDEGNENKNYSQDDEIDFHWNWKLKTPKFLLHSIKFSYKMSKDTYTRKVIWF